MKGEYDDEFSWLLCGEIAVELLSPNSTCTEGNHYTIQYDKNVRKKYARRVTVGERNHRWGNHTFLLHFELGGRLFENQNTHKTTSLEVVLTLQL